jgi:hypothetical protein
MVGGIMTMHHVRSHESLAAEVIDACASVLEETLPLRPLSMPSVSMIPSAGLAETPNTTGLEKETESNVENTDSLTGSRSADSGWESLEFTAVAVLPSSSLNDEPIKVVEIQQDLPVDRDSVPLSTTECVKSTTTSVVADTNRQNPLRRRLKAFLPKKDLISKRLSIETTTATLAEDSPRLLPVVSPWHEADDSHPGVMSVVRKNLHQARSRLADLQTGLQQHRRMALHRDRSIPSIEDEIATKSIVCQSACPRTNTPQSLPEAWDDWCRSVDSLLHSEQWCTLWASSVTVGQHAAGTLGHVALQTAALPITIPWTITVAVVHGTVHHVVQPVMHHTLHTAQIVAHHLLPFHDDMDDVDWSLEHAQVSASGEGSVTDSAAKDQSQQDSFNPIKSVIHGALGLPVFLLGAVGGVLGGILCPGTENEEESTEQATCYQTPAGESSAEHKDYLNRLRINYDVSPRKGSSKSLSSNTRKHAPKVVDADRPCRRFILRVGDLCLAPENELSNAHVSYIELTSEDKAGKILANRAIDQLVNQGLSFLANHPTVRLSKTFAPFPVNLVQWSAEGGTKNLLRKIAQMSSIERLEALRGEHLLWCGRYQNNLTPPEEHLRFGRRYSFFLARGIIEQSPRDFLHLLWDNDRTAEYNNFCLGRRTIVQLDPPSEGNDALLSGQVSVASKIIRSETRVPFTGLSVKVACLMHARPLEAPDDGYVIVTRSLEPLHARLAHVAKFDDSMLSHQFNDDKNDGNNEVLWGVNVIRRVPNHPHLTDLTSLSQVAAPKIPNFLAHRIGMMGVDDFFNNIRDPKRRAKQL